MEIGPKPFIIAEMSGNHGGNLLNAEALIEAAAKCGCDAIKVQTYKPADMLDPANNSLYGECKIPLDWFPLLFARAAAFNIPLFSSVFAPWAIDFLEQFDCPAYKLASPESTRLPQGTYGQLAEKIRATGKTFMASSGVKDMDQIHALRPDVLMYCVSGYPAKVTDGDAAYVSVMSAGYPLTAGFSDHSDDIKTPLAMIAAGARVIEKHFKLDNNCVDAAFSLDPTQMKLLCDIAHK
jgi:N-acetylneuraminate synthase